ncbi:hypothetical protein JNW90_24280 [Micromonospora sp. STR1s_5]|nr:hypothetical protein [Micromonospora sp. STR1s_5]
MTGAGQGLLEVAPAAAPTLDWVTVQASNIVAAGWPIGPRPLTCVCGAEYGRHLAQLAGDGDGPGDCPGYVRDPADALAEQALDAADNSLVEDIARHQQSQHVSRRRLPGPRASDVGACRRQVWYRETPPEGYEPRPMPPGRAAAIGTAIHKAGEEARRALYPWRMHEVEAPIPGLSSVPRIDEYDPVTGRVSDTKSCGNWMWDVYGDDGPPQSAWDQLDVNAYALDINGLPVKDVEIIGVKRENGDDESHVRPYDPERALLALDRLLELGTMLELGITPPRDGTGTQDFRCRFCPALEHCWNVEAAAAARRSPESWTLLGPEPDDASIEWAAGVMRQHADTYNAADKAKKAAATLLEGIKPGTYGELVVGVTEREMPDYKGTHERNMGYLALDPEHRPPIEVFEQVERRTDRYYTVKRVRAAQRKPKGTRSRKRS